MGDGLLTLFKLPLYGSMYTFQNVLNYMKKYLLLLTVLIIFFDSQGQEKSIERRQPTDEIICYAEYENKGTRIYPRKLSNRAKTQASATFNVTYNGFTPEAEAAFQAAVDIWAGLINSSVTINVSATWQPLEEGVLGSATWGTAFRNFEGAQKEDTWYPVALAEKMAGQELNEPSQADIVANFSSSINWYLGTDGNPGAAQFDLLSVVLHELGHGLGFVDSYNFSNGTGSFGLQSFPFIYDLNVENGTGDLLTETFSNQTTALGDQLISENLFFNSPTSEKVTGSTPRLFAPDEWNPGSSIAHLDENTYPAGNENSLMSPQIGQNEAIHDPGPITLNMFGDMGWEYTYINHDKLPNTEDFGASEYTITASIESDIDYDDNSVTLFYSLDSFATDTTELSMVATGNPDEFTADITSNSTQGQTYSYFITVADTNDRAFSLPSFVPNRLLTFTTDLDSEDPVITHEKPGFVRSDDTELKLEAVVKDFLPLASIEVEYFVNDGGAQTASFSLIDVADSLYEASIDLSGETIDEGDSIRYRIIAIDESASSNTSTFPESGLLKLDVFSLAPAVAQYSNDFNDEITSAEDFFASESFRIETPEGFQNGAIHSDHSYLDGTGPGNESNFTYELKVPIILNEEEAFMTFDEIVLVEPGESGSAFGDSDFWDYVIVEGSNDGGITWEPFIDGYDSREETDWLSTYNGSISGNNSTAEGDPTLFTTKTIDLRENTTFSGGEEILIRFRLFTDEQANGWGWAIDNLQIQIDATPPTIEHNHIDFITSNEDLELSAKAYDNFEVDSVAYVSFVNDQEQELIGFPGNGLNTYETIIDISALSLGDTIKYRIVAFDNAETPNVTYLPSEDSFFEIPFIEFGSPASDYSNNFDNGNTDFVGNFFDVSLESGFSSAAINTVHPYPSGFGIDESESQFTYTLKTPVIIDGTHPYMAFDEAFLGAIPTDSAFVEASKDGGLTWLTIEEYSSSSKTQWASAVNTNGVGTEDIYSYRLINLLKTGSLSDNDEVILRFRLKSESGNNAWGWSIDNLEIQTDAITSLAQSIDEVEVSLFPNPTYGKNLNIRIVPTGQILNGSITIINSNGQVVNVHKIANQTSAYQKEISMNSLPEGMYIVKLNLDGKSIVKKIIKTD